MEMFTSINKTPSGSKGRPPNHKDSLAFNFRRPPKPRCQDLNSKSTLIRVRCDAEKITEKLERGWPVNILNLLCAAEPRREFGSVPKKE